MDNYTALKNDHQRVKQLLNELIYLHDDDDYREVLIDQIANELVFYNSKRTVASDNSEVEALLRTLQVEDNASLDWKSTAVKLQKAVLEHMEKEEAGIVSEARKLFNNKEANMIAAASSELKKKTIEKEGY